MLVKAVCRASTAKLALYIALRVLLASAGIESSVGARAQGPVQCAQLENFCPQLQGTARRVKFAVKASSEANAVVDSPANVRGVLGVSSNLS